jgi:type II pantothenate kinase
MGKIIGIDVGGSTTKIVGFDEMEKDRLISPVFVEASDQLASVYGAFGKFTSANGIEISDVKKVMITGVGSSFIGKSIYDIPTSHLSEFKCIGRGGLFISGYDKAIIVSLGTGTAIISADKTGKTPVYEYMGGTGVGGGTIVGLSKKMLGVSDFETLVELADGGDIDKIDLHISDITKKDIGGLPSHMTASNFGKLSDIASKSDIALGILNMVFESVGMLAVFAARSKNTKDVVLTGNLSKIPQAKYVFEILSTMFDMNFVIPENAEFGTVIGAALAAFEK